jgi:hypothetical protein
MDGLQYGGVFMRDYKQMQEVKKLREQAEAEGAAPEDTRDEQEKYEKRGPGFRGWTEYIAEYYKWPIIIVGVIVIGIFVGISQLAATANPDLSMMYVGPFYMNPTEKEHLGESIAQLSGDLAGDYNQDGDFRFDFLDLTVSHVKDSEGIEYTYDDQNTTYTRFQTELRAGDTLLYFLEPYFYRQALAEGILTPLSELGIDPSLSLDGYGIPMGNLDCYELPGFAKMPAEAVVCLRRSPASDAISYGRSVEEWEYHRDLLVAMAAYKSKTVSPDTEKEPDFTLFYAGEEPIYKSVRTPVEKLLGKLAKDINGDGTTRGVLGDITRSGSVYSSEQVAKAIRTRLVTGSECLFLLDQKSYDYAKENGLLAPLPKELEALDGAVDGMALKLNALPLYNTDGYHELGAVSYLCMRKAPAEGEEAYGRTEADFEAALQMFIALAKHKG